MRLLLLTSGIHDGPEVVALLREPLTQQVRDLTVLADQFLSHHPDGEAAAFADWLEQEHGYQRLPFNEAWLPPARHRPAYAFEVEAHTQVSP